MTINIYLLNEMSCIKGWHLTLVISPYINIGIKKILKIILILGTMITNINGIKKILKCYKISKYN